MMLLIVQLTCHTAEENAADWNLKGLEDFIGANLLPEGRLTKADFEGKTAEEIKDIYSRSRFYSL